MHERIEDQLRDNACCLHPEAGSCAALTKHDTVDLLVTGSPCDPFSVQRTKRFRHDDVKSHPDFDTTMTSVVAMYQKYEPKVGVLEQVKGFSMPFHSGSPGTPLDRRGQQQCFRLSSFVVQIYSGVLGMEATTGMQATLIM